jgi:1A family penicillin-binding protein
MPIPPLFIKREIKDEPYFKKRRIRSVWKEKQQRKWQRLARKLAPFLLVLLSLGIISLIGFLAWISRDLPNPDRLLAREIPLSTKIYDRTGKTVLYEIHGAQKRSLVELSDISPYAIEATLSIEDKDFYKHPGFSFKSMIRALLVDLIKGRKVQGGSTITQQFVKNAILTQEKSFIRKIKEIILAYQIERKFSKDQILKMYLNEIPYGSLAYGIESAAQTYFHKRAKDLDIAEAALLTALPKAPSYYSPYGSHTDELIQRTHYIIDQMVKQKYITAQEGEEAKKVDILARVVKKKESIIAPHFVFYVKELLSSKFGEKTVEQGGLKVITTLDLDLQKKAEEIVKKWTEINAKKYGGTNAALVALDAPTGQILAMVGSKDYFDKSIDGNVNVALRIRNPGSSFKPIVYAAAFQKGYTPNTIIFDLPTRFPTTSGIYEPKNYDNTTRGPLTFKKALAGSINIAAVKVLYLTGLNRVLDLAQMMGYTTLTKRQDYGLALALGGGGVKLLEHTAAFAIFAQEGEKNPVTPFLKIENSKGEVLLEYKKRSQRVLDPEIARKINDILSDNQARSFVFGSHSYLYLGSRPVAAKTGTTNDFRDGWVVGYTPSLVTGVWVGNSNNEPMYRGAAGVNVAGPIWHEFMSESLANKPI